MTRRYTNPRLPLPLPLNAALLFHILCDGICASSFIFFLHLLPIFLLYSTLCHEHVH